MQWTPPSGHVGDHSDTRLAIRDERGLAWLVRIVPTGFAIGEGEEAALSDDLHASARATRGADAIVEAKLGRLGDARCARVLRWVRDDVIAGNLVVPVAQGAVDLRVAGRDVDMVRAALDEVLATLEVTQPAERKAEVELASAGCAFAPPPRFLPAVSGASPGKDVLYRTGLDDWLRVLEVWRIGRHKLKGRDLPAELAAHATASIAEWPSARGEVNRIDDFGVCLQVEQYVAFLERGAPRHTLLRWWIAGDSTLWRLASSAPPDVEREALREDVEVVQQSFRRI